MEFTVIICTYNRAGNLAQCVDALANQQGVDDRVWEVLIVDNNSTDKTKPVVDQLARESGVAVRYAFEPEQGLNHARNTGLREAKGRYVAYVDDDIIVAPSWLAALFAAFEQFDADAVGGRIHLEPSIKLPNWIQQDTDMLGFLGYQDFGDEIQRLDGRKRYPFGGNMAFQRRVVDRIGFFNPKLGRKGEGRNSSELFKGAETDYFHRLADSGDPVIIYTPDATVYHRVMPFQLKKRYFRTIHFNAGLQRAIYDNRSFPVRILNIPRFYYLQALRAAGKYLWLLVTRGPNWAFRQQMTVAHTIGTMLGYRRQSRASH